MSNLRQIHLSVRMYADDSNDVFPAPRTNFPPDAFTGFTEILRSYVGLEGTTSGGVRLFACPADTYHFDLNDHRVSESMHRQLRYYHSSYAFNGGNFMSGTPPIQRWPGLAGRKLTSVSDPGRTVLVAEFSALLPFSWHQPAGGSHYNNAQDVLGFVDGHVGLVRMYWDATNVVANHLEAWQYNPPAGYDYKWSGD